MLNARPRKPDAVEASEGALRPRVALPPDVHSALVARLIQCAERQLQEDLAHEADLATRGRPNPTLVIGAPAEDA